MAIDMQGAPQSLADLQKYVVNKPGWELVKWELYDRQAYAAAGQSQLTFFALPVGQGGKTFDDTNLNLAGQLPTNQLFMVETIEIDFFPTTPTVAAQMPSAFGAGAIAQIINDAYVFNRGGNLNFFIGSKSYLQLAPLQRFPSRANFHVEGSVSDATVAAPAQQSRIAFASSVGAPFRLNPPITLVENQNFNVILNWAGGAVALPSGNPASVFTRLCGWLLRRSQ